MCSWSPFRNFSWFRILGSFTIGSETVVCILLLFSSYSVGYWLPGSIQCTGHNLQNNSLCRLTSLLDHLCWYDLLQQLCSSEQGLLKVPSCKWGTSTSACTKIFLMKHSVLHFIECINWNSSGRSFLHKRSRFIVNIWETLGHFDCSAPCIDTVALFH